MLLVHFIHIHMNKLPSNIARLQHRYLSLFKSRQTLMLTFTGIAGYLSVRPYQSSWFALAGLIGSLVLTISGCTVLNMLIDRDIDRQMVRTHDRPLASGQVGVRSAAVLGSVLLVAGLVLSYLLSELYFLLALTGVLADVWIYTLWLKRRTAWSIIIGGVAGGIPILAGRALASGTVDIEGLLLATAIVCWIPSHNLTLGILYSEDYHRVGIPTFHNVYGLPTSRLAIILSSLITVLLVGVAFCRLGFAPIGFGILVFASLGWVGLAIFNGVRPSILALSRLYKSSSLYMLVVTLLLALAALPMGS